MHIGHTIKAISFQDIFTKEIFMESSKKLVCSSFARLPYQEALEVQTWAEDVQRVEGDCLVDGYASSLSEEAYIDLT